MKYKEIWQDEAYANLLTIREEIEKVSRSAESANNILGAICDRTDALTDFPYRDPIYSDRPALRRMVVNNDYCVYYRVIEEPYRVVRVFNVLRSSADALRHIGPIDRQ